MGTIFKNNTMNNGTQMTRIQKTVIAGLTRNPSFSLVIAGLTRNPLLTVNKYLSKFRGLRVKPAMTVF
jgi:hypothetical protein